MSAIASGPSKLPVGILHRSASNDGMEDQSWCNTDGTTFDTRIGPNYSMHRKKDASKQCLYECVAIDLFTTETKISHVARLMDLPGDHVDDSANQGYLPRTFVVNCQIPNYAVENALWGQCAGDGQGYSLVFYFVLSEYGKQQVAKRGRLVSAADDVESEMHGSLDGSGSAGPSSRSHSPHSHHHHHHHHHHRKHSGSHHRTHSGSSHAAAAAASSSSSSSSVYYNKDDPSCFRSTAEPTDSAVRLLHNFVAADEGSELRQRFKAITRMTNLDTAGLGAATKKLISSYNGTPFLIRTCSVFWRADNYFEVDVDVHRFSYMARLGLSGVRERIKDVVFDFGFVIEGHSDFELPENMLGAVRLSKMDLSLAKPFPA